MGCEANNSPFRGQAQFRCVDHVRTAGIRTIKNPPDSGFSGALARSTLEAAEKTHNPPDPEGLSRSTRRF